MDNQKAKVAAGLGALVLFVGIFLFNQVTSSTTPTSIYTPGPRQPQAVDTSPRHRTPRPKVSTFVSSRPTASQPGPRPTTTRHPVRSGTRPPVRKPPTHSKPPTHKPPTHRPTPPPPSSPPPPSNVLCRLLRILGIIC